MTHIEQAIEEAQSQGWKPQVQAFFRAQDPSYEEGLRDVNSTSLFLDPSFWQALGKARGWVDSRSLVLEGWAYYWHDFIDHLASGGDAESFFKEL